MDRNIKRNQFHFPAKTAYTKFHVSRSFADFKTLLNLTKTIKKKVEKLAKGRTKIRCSNV